MRDENGRFVTGYSGNPKGRPRKGESFADILERVLAEETEPGISRKELIARKAIELFEKTGNAKILSILLERLEGRVPNQNLNLSVKTDWQQWLIERGIDPEQFREKVIEGAVGESYRIAIESGQDHRADISGRDTEGETPITDASTATDSQEP